jgi:hypothetical protein
MHSIDHPITYRCPMHPEVTSNQPGRCSKCGMALVSSNTSSQPVTTHQKNNYLPLVVIIAMIVVATAIRSIIDYQSGQFSVSLVATYVMTGFFLVFGGFKLIDLPGFVAGYKTYDLAASRFAPYAYLYPFIEVTFGFLMLAGIHPTWLLWVEFIVMTFSGIGVAIKLARHEKFQCACLGTVLKVPLTSVTLIEDFGMAALALVIIFSA